MKSKLLFFLIYATVISPTFCQTIPLDFPILNEYLRREQVLGNLNSSFSFNYRPMMVEKAFPELDTTFVKSIFKNKRSDSDFTLKILPLQSTFVLNSNRPHGEGNGAILPAKGGQILLSAGTFLKWGPLRVQLYPQFHFAQNSPFEEYPKDAPSAYFQAIRNDVRGTDKPVRHGTGKIKRFLPGNSNVMLDFGSFAAGVSTENIWWGPGTSTALLLSDNAEGFIHATIKTTRPAKTFLGHFEGEYFAGSLEGSNLPYFSDGYQDSRMSGNRDDEMIRYFTGLSITYSPKWVQGFSIGGSRTFQVYRNDMADNFRAWFPLFDPLPKTGVGNVENIMLREDQHISFFFRWIVPKARFEFYGEYLRNDHSLNWRDAVMNPEHSRGYILGMTKYFPLSQPSSFIEFQLEMVQTQNSINRLIRYSGIDRGINLYYNGQVTHGITHKGKVLGSNLGLSGNLQRFSISKVKGANKIGFQGARKVHDSHTQLLGSVLGLNMKPWIDLSGGFVGSYAAGQQLLISGDVNGILTVNENWLVPSSSATKSIGNNHRTTYNFNLNVAISYSF